MELGIRWHLGQPCQKQPSTNTARRCTGKTKSGFPVKSAAFRVQPRIPARTKAARRRHSVERFPLERTCAITLERVSGVTQSTSNLFARFNRGSRAASFFVPLRCQSLKPYSLRHQCTPQPLGHAAFANHPCESRNSCRSSSDSHIRITAKTRLLRTVAACDTNLAFGLSKPQLCRGPRALDRCLLPRCRPLQLRSFRHPGQRLRSGIRNREANPELSTPLRSWFR